MNINKNVADAFLRKEKLQTTHLTSTGKRLFSYYTCIAEWIPVNEGNNFIILGNHSKYSTTTSRHMSYIRKHVDIWTTKPVPIETEHLISYK